MDNQISLVKQQLEFALGPENFQRYLYLLRDWFGEKMTKSMFDHEVWSLFDESCFNLHNLLLRSILSVSFADEFSTAAASQYVPNQTSSSVPGVTSVENVTVQATATESQFQNEEDIYIIPPVPGEEPFLYPPHAIDYPASPNDMEGAVDLMEQDPPPDCDWLEPFEIAYAANESEVPKPIYKNRFPVCYASSQQAVNTKSYTSGVNVVKNVTHFCQDLKDMIERKPQLSQHFVVPANKITPYLTSGCSLYGRILITAWTYSIQNVNVLVTEQAVIAVKEHLKKVLTSIITQRRPFRMRDKRIVHSVGVPYPNPYLRQGFHLYDEAYGTDTTKMADVVMQVPSPFPTIDEKERLAALQVAACHPSKDSKFISAKGTMMDFLYAIEQNPNLIPNHKSRFKLIDTLVRKGKGFGGSHNVQFGESYDEDEEAFQPSPLLPLASY